MLTFSSTARRKSKRYRRGGPELSEALYVIASRLCGCGPSAGFAHPPDSPFSHALADAGAPASTSTAQNQRTSGTLSHHIMNMRPVSPRKAQFARLEEDGVPARAARRVGWPRLAVGVVILVGFIHAFMPAGYTAGIKSFGWAASNPYDQLVLVSRCLFDGANTSLIEWRSLPMYRGRSHPLILSPLHRSRQIQTPPEQCTAACRTHQCCRAGSSSTPS
jgi:hypothetical protein